MRKKKRRFAVPCPRCTLDEPSISPAATSAAASGAPASQQTMTWSISRFTAERRCASISTLAPSSSKPDDLNERHRRIVLAHDLAIASAQRRERRAILGFVDDVPGEAHEMFGLAAGGAKNDDDVAQRLERLLEKIVGRRVRRVRSNRSDRRSLGDGPARARRLRNRSGAATGGLYRFAHA